MRNKRLFIFLLALLLVFAPVSSVLAAPYTAGEHYEQPQSVIDEYFPKVNLPYSTPGIGEGRVAFTSHEELLDFVNDAAKRTDKMSVRYIGKSQEGRDMPILIFDNDGLTSGSKIRATGKPIVWIQAQIHGNEPAGGEGALLLIRDLVDGELGKNVLDKISIVILPRFNVDGSYYFQRQTATKIDCNRDHLKYDLKETRLVHKAFNEFSPEVAVDLHEYGVDWAFSKLGPKGALTYYDILISSAKNLNIPKEVRDMSNDLFVKNARASLSENGITSAPYYTSRHKDGSYTLYEAGSDPKIGRNAYGLQPSFSFLVETRGIGIGRENFERRVYSHYMTAKSIIETSAANAKTIKDTIAKARRDIVAMGTNLNEDNVIILDQENILETNFPFEVIDLETNKLKTVEMNFFNTTNAKPTKTRQRPRAYILPPAYHDVAERLYYSGVEVKRLNKDIKLPVEVFTVESSEVETRYYEGHYRNTVTVKLRNESVDFLKGSYVFTMDQPTANLIAMALEPDAVDSFVKFNLIQVNEGDEVPIYRYLGSTPLDASIVRDFK